MMASHRHRITGNVKASRRHAERARSEVRKGSRAAMQMLFLRREGDQAIDHNAML